MKYKATAYRSYEVELEFDENDAPGMTGLSDKAEFLSRSISIDQWKLLDVSIDIWSVE